MKHFVSTAAILLAMGSGAMAQQPAPAAYNLLQLPQADIDSISEGLSKLPYEKAAPLMARIWQQVIAQRQANEAMTKKAADDAKAAETQKVIEAAKAEQAAKDAAAAKLLEQSSSTNAVSVPEQK